MAEVNLAPVRTVEQAGLPSARVDQQAPVEAFGGGASLTQATDASVNLAGNAKDIAVQETLKANQVAVLDAVNQAKPLATDIQVQTSKMLGKDAAAAPEVVNKSWADGTQKIRSGLSNDAQRMAFDRHIQDTGAELYKSTQVHVAGQLQAYDDTQTTSFIENSKTRAVVNSSDPSLVANEIEQQKAVINDWARRKGIATDSEEYKAKMTDVLSGTHSAVLQEMLDTGKDPQAAQYLADNRANMSGSDVNRVEKLVERSKDVALSVSTYNDVKGFKLADGSPDEAKMEKSVMGMPDLTDERKLRILGFVKARAGEDLANRTRALAANDRSFMNQAVQLRQGGGSIDDALKLVPKFSVDPYDQSVKEAALQKMWAPPSESDVKVKNALWTGIQEGTTTKGDLDMALKSGKINEKDWSTLQEENYKATIEGRSPEMKLTNQRVKELAAAQFGSDKDKSAAFEITVNESARGKSADEKWKIANDKIKEAPGTGWFGSNFFAKPQYTVDADKGNATSLAFGKASEDLGDDTVRALKAGAARTGKTFSPADLDAMSVQFGGYQNIKPGTPVHDAMQLLMKNGKYVTPANIKAVLDNGLVGKR